MKTVLNGQEVECALKSLNSWLSFVENHVALVVSNLVGFMVNTIKTFFIYLHYCFYTNEMFETFLANDTEVQIVNSPGKAYKQYTKMDSKDFSMNYPLHLLP